MAGIGRFRVSECVAGRGNRIRGRDAEGLRALSMWLGSLWFGGCVRACAAGADSSSLRMHALVCFHADI